MSFLTIRFYQHRRDSPIINPLPGGLGDLASRIPSCRLDALSGSRNQFSLFLSFFRLQRNWTCLSYLLPPPLAFFNFSLDRGSHRVLSPGPDELWFITRLIQLPFHLSHLLYNGRWLGMSISEFQMKKWILKLSLSFISTNFHSLISVVNFTEYRCYSTHHYGVPKYANFRRNCRLSAFQ